MKLTSKLALVMTLTLAAAGIAHGQAMPLRVTDKGPFASSLQVGAFKGMKYYNVKAVKEGGKVAIKFNESVVVSGSSKATSLVNARVSSSSRLAPFSYNSGSLRLDQLEEGKSYTVKVLALTKGYCASVDESNHYSVQDCRKVVID